MFEHHTHPLLPRPLFALRLLRNAGMAGLLMGIALVIGMFGYAHFNDEELPDAYVDASMILSGMGPVSTLKCTSAKIFAGSYALASGLVLLSASTILVAPVLHRLFHRLHAQVDPEGEPAKRRATRGPQSRKS